MGKNAELEKQRAQGKYIKPFETDILKLRADELNYTLCMFVKEVRKPNGDAYAADSILYLTLGIQEYLFTSGRIDNLFTDVYYEAFTTALHEVIKDFKLPTNQMGYFVTRIEEEHLWEAKQLGAHSPQVILKFLDFQTFEQFSLPFLDASATLYSNYFALSVFKLSLICNPTPFLSHSLALPFMNNPASLNSRSLVFPLIYNQLSTPAN